MQLYLKKFEVCKVMDCIFTGKNLHLLKDYMYYNLVMFIMNLWSYIYYRFMFEDIPGHFYIS